MPLMFVALAGLDLPADGPVPVDKPEQATAPEPAAKAPGNAKIPNAAAADQKPAPLPGITTPEESEAALAGCEAELRKLQVTFDRLEPVTGENGCGITAPYAITEIAKGVSFSPATEMRCETALSLARWVEGVVLPATASLPGKARLTAINHGSTYVCRRRNNLPTGKMSEHSIGNAVDVVDFEFDGRGPIGIVPRAGDGNIEEAFQRAVRGGACLHFTTVLGPGADASHDDHLHFDIAERRGGYRLCE
ncbi:MAG: extensin family protein [Hoeflea sp.]|uniref:extensin-like domain-containing protein n=1 Tax=Hoeflea sp. TaxID=1940281 RepID=UPI001E0452A0|nr:extensin family protein [Hoeflea sp.]MBU4527297.1 extensin family protein [Alphaproteobacteria bacterium]MBU4546920.1 extensin family protein [Alphaproteobacteria bacterium]MBU4551568.1 extensin family protein [Alphaproteobacteria bacterium]MBV1725573.1 extensin family protein [Hoeflea sp.]MBV1759621.1 extensin family protein [Hoeflea sp.]